MNILILGNGGALSDGLPYNAFLIDGFFLNETPPDIMGSLYREAVDLSALSVVFISHFHADHCFGFPFLVLRLFFNRTDAVITVIGPPDCERVIRRLCSLAFGEDHPMMTWFDRSLRFTACGNGTIIEIDERHHLHTFSLFHFTETYGYTLYRDETPRCTYLADTVWHETLAEQLARGGTTIIADLNGEPTDPIAVHLSEDDAIHRLLPRCAPDTVIYGTHLKSTKLSRHERIRFLRPGDVVEC